MRADAARARGPGLTGFTRHHVSLVLGGIYLPVTCIAVLSDMTLTRVGFQENNRNILFHDKLWRRRPSYY